MFNFLPEFKTFLKDGMHHEIESKCFKKITFSVSEDEHHLIVKIKPSDARERFCTDTLLFATLEEVQYTRLFFARTTYIKFKKEDNHWDLKERGLMLFDFKQPISTLIHNAVLTAEMFAGFLYLDVP